MTAGQNDDPVSPQDEAQDRPDQPTQPARPQRRTPTDEPQPTDEVRAGAQPNPPGGDIGMPEAEPTIAETDQQAAILAAKERMTAEAHERAGIPDPYENAIKPGDAPSDLAGRGEGAEDEFESDTGTEDDDADTDETHTISDDRDTLEDDIDADDEDDEERP